MLDLSIVYAYNSTQMTSHESDGDTVRDIENFLRTFSMLAQEERMQEFLNRTQNVSMNMVPQEQAVTSSDETAELVKDIVQIVSRKEFSIAKILNMHPNSRFKAFTIHLGGLGSRAIPDFLPANFIIFEENHVSESTEIEFLTDSLGFDKNRSASLLTILGKAGAITDPQTRPIMEQAIVKFPTALEFDYCSTGYVISDNRMGKVVRLPQTLMGKRIIKDERNSTLKYALSEITSGDLVVAKTALLAVKRGLTS